MIVDAVADIVRRRVPSDRSLRHLDIGAGWGDLIKRLRKSHPGIQSFGVDYNPSHFDLTDVPIAHADLNVERLPYDDRSFDLVTCTEVIEHLENFRWVVREAARVARPGGLFVGSTPNVLSIKSRWAYFTRGFFTYFDPLPLKDDPGLYPGQRHLTPVPFFYFGHALLDSGFEGVEPHADKSQRSSAFWAVVLLPLLKLVATGARRRRIRHSGARLDSIEEMAERNNSWPVLTGRTLIVTARRSAGA